MRIRYIIPIKGKLVVPDHWTIPIQGGSCRIIEEAGLAKALEITFANQSIEHAPHIKKLENGSTEILVRDPLWLFVKQQLDGAMAFLHCFHDIVLATEEPDIRYEGETEEEERKIAVKSMAQKFEETPIHISFDMFTRAIMAANKNNAPKFESTLARAASKSLSDQQFINSFRYSFLLIESLYGRGQFKSSKLKEALKNNAFFVKMVKENMSDPLMMKSRHISDTTELLATPPSAERIIEHLVEKRGFYFHGNIERKDAWRPEQQQEAEALAIFSIGLVLLITREASTPMFDECFAAQHYEDAKNAGATIVFHVNFKFQDPIRNSSHTNQINIETPGTKLTSKIALDVAKLFLEKFEYYHPLAKLEHVECLTQDRSEKIFEMKFHTKK